MHLFLIFLKVLNLVGGVKFGCFALLTLLINKFYTMLKFLSNFVTKFFCAEKKKPRQVEVSKLYTVIKNGNP